VRGQRYLPTSFSRSVTAQPRGVRRRRFTLPLLLSKRYPSIHAQRVAWPRETRCASRFAGMRSMPGSVRVWRHPARSFAYSACRTAGCRNSRNFIAADDLLPAGGHDPIFAATRTGSHAQWLYERGVDRAVAIDGICWSAQHRIRHSPGTRLICWPGGRLRYR
jgi:hypothetical protein